MADKKAYPWRMALTAGFTLAVFFFGRLGVRYPTFTLERTLPLLAQLGFSTALFFWAVYCLWLAIRRHAFGEWLSALVAVLALFLVFIWPFTTCFGRRNDSRYRGERETVVALWRDGALERETASGWTLPRGMDDIAWNQKLGVYQNTFIFDVYNDFFRYADLLYSPEERPLWAGGNLVSLGDGWYWRVEGY